MPALSNSKTRPLQSSTASSRTTDSIPHGHLRLHTRITQDQHWPRYFDNGHLQILEKNRAYS